MRYSLLSLLAFFALLFSAVFAADEVSTPPGPQAKEIQDNFGKIGVIVGLLSGPGFTIWFAYYTVRVLWPKERKENREQIEKITEQFLLEMKEQRATYLTDKKESEIRHASQLTTAAVDAKEAVRDAMRMKKESDDAFREELKEIRGAIEKNECKAANVR